MLTYTIFFLFYYHTETSRPNYCITNVIKINLNLQNYSVFIIANLADKLQNRFLKRIFQSSLLSI